MIELLFHTPWWLPVAIAVVGICVFVTGNKRTDARTRTIGLGIVFLAALLAVLSYFVETPVERSVRLTKEFVAAFERQDYAAMSGILQPSTSVGVTGATIYASREQIVARAKSAHQQYGFKSVRVLTSSVERHQTQITVTITLLSEQNITPTLTSEWQFEWQESSEGWSLAEIRALKIANVTGDQIAGMLRR
jgi:hypothetical protein